MGGVLAAGLATEVIVLVMLCIASAALAVVGVVRATRQRSEGGVGSLAAGPIAVATVALFTSVALLLGWDPTDPEGLQRRAVSHGAAAFLLPVAGFPAVAVAVAGVAWMGSRAPRRPSLAARVAVPGLLAALGVGIGALGQPGALFSGLRSLSIAAFTLALALGGLRDDPRGAEVRAVGLGILVLVVAGLEASYGGLITLLTVGQVDHLTPDTWSAALDAFDGVVRRPRLAGGAALGVAALGALAALRPVGRGVRGVVAACVLLGTLLLAASRPGAAQLRSLAVLCAAPPAEGGAGEP